jgi:hypothetical protein
MGNFNKFFIKIFYRKKENYDELIGFISSS